MNKDVPEGAIAGGNPARVIGSFEELMEKRQAEMSVSIRKSDRTENLWREFEKAHKNL